MCVIAKWQQGETRAPHGCPKQVLHMQGQKFAVASCFKRVERKTKTVRTRVKEIERKKRNRKERIELEK